MAKSPKPLTGTNGGGRRAPDAARAPAPAEIQNRGSEMIAIRIASSVVDQLDAAAEAAGTTRKVIITRALAKAGFRIPQPDLEDRTPRRRRRAA